MVHGMLLNQISHICDFKHCYLDGGEDALVLLRNYLPIEIILEFWSLGKMLK